MSPMADWLIPDWPAPACVKALCTTRNGGHSLAPYDSLNLGTHVGDDIAAVQANRALLRQALGAHPVFLNQVHGTHVEALHASTPDGMQADACLSLAPGVVCTIMVADCLPILLCDTSGAWVAGAHAGWRGLVGQGGGGVVESTLAAAYKENSALAPADTALAAPKVISWLGPCIGPTAFEVGGEVRQAFLDAASGDAAEVSAVDACFVPLTPGKWLGNLPALARLRLRAAGVYAIHGNDGSPAWCTVSNPSRFFSHRRDRVSGRLAACVWLDERAV